MGILNLQKMNWQRVVLIVLVTGSALGFIRAVSDFGSGMLPQLGELGSISDTPLTWQASLEAAAKTVGTLIILGLLWLARNYMVLTESQKRIDILPRLANAAINYAEDVDQRGDREAAYHNLDLPDGMVTNPSAGHQKLALASSWLVEEAKKQGLKRMSVEQASRWVAAEFQRNVNDMRAAHSVSARTDMAAELLNQLGHDGHIVLPSNNFETVALIQGIADWAATGREGKDNKIILRDIAMARIAPQTLMMGGANGRSNGNGKIAPEVRLTLLAKQALEFVAELQRQGKLKLSEKETAKAWMIQQAQLDDIAATPEQIESALAKVSQLKPA